MGAAGVWLLLCSSLCVSLCVSLSLAAQPAGAPEAAVGACRVRGKWLQSRAGRSIAAFEGIRFAQPPVGALRFKAPVPPKPCTSVLNATAPGSPCTQRDIYFAGVNTAVYGSEDCLFLNVYTPKDFNKKKPLTVMFYVHGGGWLSNAGSAHQPNYILDNDVVLVTHNYRLGPLGFLSTLDDVIPGNFGLKDHVRALQWVKENIAAFGGDPNNVLIFGESAGGASVHYLMLSPLAKGLFHRAALTSGSTLARYALAPAAETRQLVPRLAKFLGCPAAPSRKFRDCLLTKSATEITSVDLSLLEFSAYPFIPFKPVVEPKAPGAFLDTPIREAIKTRRFIDVPLMVGTMAQEGCFVATGILENDTLTTEFNRRFSNLLPMVIMIRDNPKPVVNKAVQEIRKFYIGEQRVSKKMKFQTIDMFSDPLWMWPLYQVVQLHAQHSKAPVYFYEFVYVAQQSASMLLGSKRNDYGTCHVDDLINLFPFDALIPGARLSQTDIKTSQKLISFYVNFAKTGNPSSSWRRVKNAKNPEFLIIKNANDTTMQQNFKAKRMQFWQKLDVSP